jgi:hypothetical protein
VLDVGAGGLRYPKPVEGEQGDQGALGGRAEPGGANLVAVQGGGVRLVVQPGTPDVRGRRVVEPGQCQALVALLVSGARIGTHGFFEMHQLTRMESASLEPRATCRLRAGLSR